jgi:hypothetical protein
MKMSRSMVIAVSLAVGCSLVALGCEKKQQAAHSGNNSHDHDDHEHASGDSHDHDHENHGPVTDLGEQTSGGLVVKASRSGDVKAGAEATFDVVITGESAKPAAVRVWVGTQDAKGSIKAKAEAEDGGWHAHAEVPNPMPSDAMFWVEIETDKGERVQVSFALKL